MSEEFRYFPVGCQVRLAPRQGRKWPRGLGVVENRAGQSLNTGTAVVRWSELPEEDMATVGAFRLTKLRLFRDYEERVEVEPQVQPSASNTRYERSLAQRRASKGRYFHLYLTEGAEWQGQVVEPSGKTRPVQQCDPVRLLWEARKERCSVRVMVKIGEWWEVVEEWS